MPCGSKPGSAATAKRLEGLLKICTGAVPPGASPWRSALEIFVISAEKKLRRSAARTEISSISPPCLSGCKRAVGKGKIPALRPRDAGHRVPASALHPPPVRSSPEGGNRGGRSPQPYATGEGRRSGGAGGGSRGTGRLPDSLGSRVVLAGR